MVKKFGDDGKTSIQADVIVLGCTLPGIVAAHKLKTKFGDTMDIVVLDLTGPSNRSMSKCNVSFMPQPESDAEPETQRLYDYSAKELLDNVARFYLLQYANEFKIHLPDPIIHPEGVKKESPPEPPIETETRPEEPEKLLVQEEESVPLHKLFQYPNGNTVQYLNNVHDFEYLNFLEKFELNQYQAFLDRSMSDLFQTNKIYAEEERQMLMHYDRTTMETNICETLLFSTSRDIMRIIVRLVCGAPANSVSLLFYLHQCYRTSSTKNHLSGLNTRFREKLLGHCRKRLSNKFLQSIADITLPARSIKEIRTYSEQVILETRKGETTITYICNLLAMALRPDQLNDIQVENELIADEKLKIAKEMRPGCAKKFNIQYNQNLWNKQGYSGDIFSMRGPIIWAMEKPILSTTGSMQKYPTLIGYLMVQDEKNKEGQNSKEAVIEQLVKMFGADAANPVKYSETLIADVYIPRCGDYVALRKMTNEGSPKFLEWGALDVFADGDVAAALEAGHCAYLHLLSCLRPQAQTYDDIIVQDWPTILCESPVRRWVSQINVISGIKMTMFTAAMCIGMTLLRSYVNK